ncbi:hypothetical protein ACFLYA_02145 [Candidatus Dependentiae bacterium]
MKNIKYFVLLSAMLAITSNTSYTMKKTALKDLGKPVFSRTFKEKIKKIETNLDCKILCIELETSPQKKQHVVQLINWENKKEKMVTIEKKYQLAYIGFSSGDSYVILNLKNCTSLGDKKIKIIDTNTLCPPISHSEVRKKLLEPKNRNVTHICKSLMVLDGINLRKKYLTYSVILMKRIKMNWHSTDKTLKTFKHAKFGKLSPSPSKYLKMEGVKDGSLKIYDITDIVNSKMIINLGKNQYDDYHFVGPDHMLIKKGDTIEIFDLDKIKPIIYACQENLYNQINGDYVDLIVQTETK